METAIHKQGPYLVAVIQGIPTDQDLLALRDTLADQVTKSQSRGVVVDVTTMDVLDSYSTRLLRDVARMTQLQGAETVIVGIQPEVAAAMRRAGLRIEGVTDASSIGDAITYLDKRSTPDVGEN